MSDPETTDIPGSSHKRRKYLKWWLLTALLLLPLWLNGPGLRWLAPKVATHFLGKSGLQTSFRMQGTLTHGFSLHDLEVSSPGTLERVTIDKMIPKYKISRLMRGKLDGVEIDGAHVQLRLGIDDKRPDQPPLDLTKITSSLASIRSQIIPLDISVESLSVVASRNGIMQYQLGKSDVHHRSGSDFISLKLGKITDPQARELPSQAVKIEWDIAGFQLERLDLLPSVGLRQLTLDLPANGESVLETEIVMDDAVLILATSPGLGAARMDLREGSIQLDQSIKRFGIDLPAKARITSLAIEIEDLLPDPKLATGSARFLFEDVVYDQWSAAEISIDAALATEGIQVTSQAEFGESDLSLTATIPLDRTNGRFGIGNVEGRFEIPGVPELVRELAKRIPTLDPAAPVPMSAATGKFTLDLDENSLVGVAARLAITPAIPEAASPLTVEGKWLPKGDLTAKLELDGGQAEVTLDADFSSYQGSVRLNQFSSGRIEPWLAVAKIALPGSANATGTWQGSGNLKSTVHRGVLSLESGSWARRDAPTISGSGGVIYAWPDSFKTSNLQVKMDNQSISLDASLENELLTVGKLLWTDGTNPLVDGKAVLPVPRDLKKWREMLADDPRPVSITLNSKVIPLSFLKQWAPGVSQLNPEATGQLDIAISGTYFSPTIAAKLEAKDLGSPSQPSLPPADLKLELATVGDQLIVSGSLLAPEFAPAEISALMRFRPGEWAKDPKIILTEPLSARVNLPRIDISRFTSLVVPAQKVEGVLTGNIDVTGSLEKPAMRGALDLKGGGVDFSDEKLPDIEGMTAAVELALDQVTLRSLNMSLAGGSLSGDGKLLVTKDGLGDLDFRVKGNHVPVLRNDYLIVRGNADIRLRGPWKSPEISGTAGVVDSLFYRDIEILPIGTPFTGPSAAALPRIDSPAIAAKEIPEPFRDWRLNVTLRTEDPILIRGNLAAGEITGSMKIRGTIGAPAPDGVFKVDNLKASLPFSTLTVRSGTATFVPTGGFDPVLDIRGTAEPRPYVITAFVHGKASDPQLILTSNPPLPDNEIMTLLATGTTTSGLEDPQAASSRALQLLIEEVRRGRFRYGKQLRPLLGLLDNVDFSLADKDPYSTESFSTATLTLTDRWFISAGVGSSGDSRVLAIWRIAFQ